MRKIEKKGNNKSAMYRFSGSFGYVNIYKTYYQGKLVWLAHFWNDAMKAGCHGLESGFKTFSLLRDAKEYFNNIK